MPRPEPLSPELVLVAPPEEAQRAREELADAPAAPEAAVESPAEGWDDLLARIRAEPVPATAEEPPPQQQPAKRRRSRWPVVGVAALVLAVLVGVAWARRDSSHPRLVGPTSASPPAATAPAPPNPVKPPPVRVKPKARAKKHVAAPNPARKKSRTPARAAGAFVPSRVWSWEPVRGSTRYRVQFFREGRKVLDLGTARARIVLPKSFAFHKGRYRWTVVALAPGKSQRRIVDSSFVVARG